MNSFDYIDIEFYKNEFQDIIKMNNDILDVKKTINNKLIVLKQTYNNLIKNNYKKIYIFCLDSFYFQYKILSFEMENTANFIILINNRMYGDYYKLYNIILLYCKEKNIELNIEINKDKYPVYKDLEPFYEYTIIEIHKLFLEILKIISELYKNHSNTENKINEYKNNINNGLSISNLINTLECENSILREQILLYLNYISFFHNIQKDYLIKLLLKVNNFHKEIDEYLSSNDIEISLKQFNLYVNKETSNSIIIMNNRSNNNSPVNSIHSSVDSRFSSPNHSRSQIVKKRIQNSNNNSPKKEFDPPKTDETIKKELDQPKTDEIIKTEVDPPKTENNFNPFENSKKKNNINNIFFINPMKNKNK